MRNIIIVVVSLAATGALAQPVWRCGNSYGSVPCEGGARVDRATPATGTDAAQARAVGQADAKLAAALEQARLKREKEAPKAVLPPAPAAAASAPAKDAAKTEGARKESADAARKRKGPAQFTAVAPGPARKK